MAASQHQHTSRSGRPSGIAAIGTSPWLWGALLTVGFYQAIPHLPMYRELAERYFCGHPLEYGIAGLFFLGISILGVKMLRLNTENAALKADRLSGAKLSDVTDANQAADALENYLELLPRHWQDSYIARRISDACSYVRGRGTAEGLEDHLKYVADQEFDRAHESLGLVRTINWAVPIIGFLGTVMGITLAIANVAGDPEQLTSSLSAVTSGLAVAFDTTALSLSLSLVLVFFQFLVAKSEKNVLVYVEDFANRQLVYFFPQSGSTGSTGTIADVQQQAAQKLLEKTEAVIQFQTDLWQQSLEGLRNRWNDTLTEQQHKLAKSLQDGMQATITNHVDQLSEIRDGFAAAFQQISQHVQHHISKGQEQQQQQMQELITQLTDKTTAWQDKLGETTTLLQEHAGELAAQKDVLLQVVSGEKDLVRLQGQLAENLEAVRTAEAFEQTLHSLSAAVHLLTARNRTNAA